MFPLVPLVHGYRWCGGEHHCLCGPSLIILSVYLIHLRSYCKCNESKLYIKWPPIKFQNQAHGFQEGGDAFKDMECWQKCEDIGLKLVSEPHKTSIIYVHYMLGEVQGNIYRRSLKVCFKILTKLTKVHKPNIFRYHLPEYKKYSSLIPGYGFLLEM